MEDAQIPRHKPELQNYHMLVRRKFVLSKLGKKAILDITGSERSGTCNFANIYESRVYFRCVANWAYFFGDIPTALVKDFKKLL